MGKHSYIIFWVTITATASTIHPLIEIAWFDPALSEEGYPVMHGFPLIYRSEVPYVMTMHGLIDWSRFILNVIIIGSVLFAVLYCSEFTDRLKNKYIILLLKSVLLIWFLIGIIVLIVVDWNSTDILNDYDPNYELSISRIMWFDV